MFINFYNKNAEIAYFKIDWGFGITPPFELKAGDMGGFDLSTLWRINEGAKCCVYAWADGSMRACERKIYFDYKKDEPQETFYFSVDNKAQNCDFTAGEFVFKF